MVLLADDQDCIRDLFLPQLQAHGFEARSARDGFDGIHEVQRVTPDVIVMDLVMLNCDESEAIMRLRKRHPQLPIIAMSGAAAGTTAYLPAYEHLGANAVLTQPFAFRQLLALIHAVLPINLSATA